MFLDVDHSQIGHDLQGDHYSHNFFILLRQEGLEEGPACADEHDGSEHGHTLEAAQAREVSGSVY